MTASSSGPIVFIGDSITEQWSWFRPSLFASGRFVNRGMGGQTTRDVRDRFLDEIRQTGARGVHILAGINDIAGNGGPIAVAETQDNIAWMVDRATEHGCGVLVGSITPADVIVWNRSVRPLPMIAAVNAGLREIAAARGATYVDYHAPLRSPAGGLRAGLGPDGLHLNKRGYRLLEPVLLAAVSARFGIDAGEPPPLFDRVRRFLTGRAG